MGCNSSLALAQYYTENEVKSALVGKIISQITWKSGKPSNSINIIVYRDKEMQTALTQLETAKINGKSINVTGVSTLKDARKAHVLYLPQAFNHEISNIVSSLRGSSTLLITENSPTLHNIMINIVEQQDIKKEKSHFGFQINRPNLSLENLSILPDLLIYGGTELDVAEIYRDTEAALLKLLDENELANMKLKQEHALLENKEMELLKLEHESKELSKRLKKQQHLLSEKERLLIDLTEKVKRANQKHLTAVEESELKSEELKEVERLFEIQKSEVQRQSDLLDRLRAEVVNNQNLLDSKSLKLEKKQLEVWNLSKLIDKQSQVIWFTSILIVIAIAVSIFITKLLLKNRRINKKLEYTIQRLENTKDKLVESEKMASLGNLIAGVAHELNTPLGISLTAASTIGDVGRTLKSRVDENKLKKSELNNFILKLGELDQLICSNLERCHDLINSFKQVSADQVVAKHREIYLKDYLQEILNTLSIYLRKNEVSCEIFGDNPLIMVDPSILNQILNNLTTNAIVHAFEGKESKKIKLQVITEDSQYKVAFKDNGKGMDERTQQRVFEPFFTTKRGQGGTGLGLNIVHNLVYSKLGGTININSHLGQGTSFIITLPKVI